MEVPALLISIFALLFTVASFWRMNWRRGNLRVSGPRSFQAVGSEDGKVVVILPLVFYNDGAAPMIIENLRLILLWEKEGIPLAFNSTIETLAYEAEKRQRKFATGLVVRGGEARLEICEFRRNPGHLLFEAKSYPMELQARLGHRQTWGRLHRFSLNVTERALPAINQKFLIHDNEVGESGS